MHQISCTADALSELGASESASIMLSTSLCLCSALCRICVISVMILPVVIYIAHSSMDYCRTIGVAYPENIQPLFQSILAILEQCAQLSLTEKQFDFTTTLLSLNKGMNFVEGPK